MLDELSIRLTCECGCESVATFESSRIFELRIFHDQSVRVAILKKSELIQIYTERGREGGGCKMEIQRISMTSVILSTGQVRFVHNKIAYRWELKCQSFMKIGQHY